MIKISYDRWFELARQLHYDYDNYLYNIEGIQSILRCEFQARVRPLLEAYMLAFEIMFDHTQTETIFRLRYSEYL